MIENFLWDVSKPEIRIFFPHRIEEFRGECEGWSFVLPMALYDGVWRRSVGGGLEEEVWIRGYGEGREG